MMLLPRRVHDEPASLPSHKHGCPASNLKNGPKTGVGAPASLQTAPERTGLQSVCRREPSWIPKRVPQWANYQAPQVCTPACVSHHQFLGTPSVYVTHHQFPRCVPACAATINSQVCSAKCSHATTSQGSSQQADHHPCAGRGVLGTNRMFVKHRATAQFKYRQTS
jgi:hypothetical protein